MQLIVVHLVGAENGRILTGSTKAHTFTVLTMNENIGFTETAQHC